MTITRTTRFGLYRWSSFIDAFTRTQMDESYENIEQYGLKMLSGPELPEDGSAEYALTFFLNTTDEKLYYYTTDDANGEWIKIEPNGIRFTVAEDKGDMLVASGPDEWARLPVGSRNQILTVLDDDGTIGWSTILNNRGDLLSSNGSDVEILGVGPNSTTLRANNATSTGLSWGLIVESNIANSAFTTEKIANNAVTTFVIADNAVTTSVIANDAITSALFAAGSVTNSKLGSGSVTSSKIANLTLTSEKLADLSVSAIKIADRAVTTSAIADGAVTQEKIADSAVSESKISNGAATSSRIGLGAVTESKILDGAVTGQKIASLAVTTPKLADLAVTETKYADSTITTAKFEPLSVTSSKILNSSLTSVLFADGAVTTPKLGDDSVTTSKIADLAVTGAKFADGSVEQQKIGINTVSNDRLRKSVGLSVIGNPTSSLGDVQDIPASIDHSSLKRSGDSIVFGLISESDIPDGAITRDKVALDAVVDAKISESAALDLVKFAPGQLPDRVKVTTPNYIDGSFSVNKLSPLQTADGVCSWVPYMPTLYSIPAWEYETVAGTFGPVTDWFQKHERLENPTAYPEPSSRYNVIHAKYARIGNICYVSCSIEYTFQNTFWPNRPQYSTALPAFYNAEGLVTAGPNAATVLPTYPLVSLPFPQAVEDGCTTGGMRVWQSRALNIFVSDNRTSGTRYVSSTLRAIYGETAWCSPMIWKNLVVPFYETTLDRGNNFKYNYFGCLFQMNSRNLFRMNKFQTENTSPNELGGDGQTGDDIFTATTSRIPAAQLIRNRIRPFALVPGTRIDFTIYYETA